MPAAGVGPVAYLRSVVSDANAPRRDRGSAARALIAKAARDKKEKAADRRKKERAS